MFFCIRVLRNSLVCIICLGRLHGVYSADTEASSQLLFSNGAAQNAELVPNATHNVKRPLRDSTDELWGHPPALLNDDAHSVECSSYSAIFTSLFQPNRTVHAWGHNHGAVVHSSVSKHKVALRTLLYERARFKQISACFVMVEYKQYWK